jgi:acetolactate synthase-1/2/3 large subunit
MGQQRWGSDVMVDAIKACGFRYVSLNPGSSFRGLHDSLVNYGGNTMPEMITCNHEKLAVGIAHGYAKATGEPMACILHDIVGLLQGTMGIYYAYIDRAPVVVFGGAGPMAYDRRRPNIDWIHTANVQGNVVRDYTKWDDQPASVASVPESIARGYRVATAAPQGPVYIALDAGLQEDEAGEVELPDFERLRTPSRIGPDPRALRELATALCASERPVLVAGYPGRDANAFGQLVELAELLGAGVVDTGWRLNFPNRHRFNVTDSDAVDEADCILFVDVKDMGKWTQELDRTTRRIRSRIQPGTKVLDVGFNELGLSAWSHDFGQLRETDLQVTADTAVALPLLLELCRELNGNSREPWRQRLADLHDGTRSGWAADAEDERGLSPVATSRLATEVWEVVRDYDWVLTAGTASDQVQRVWDFDRFYRHPGRSLGTATQIGISLGVALAYKDTDKLVVDLQPDGDLMFDLGALWIAAYHRLPLLVVMFNNRAYYNDWEHQIRIAKHRGTDVERAYIGMEIGKPAPDFAAAARALGWHGEGPIEDSEQVQAAVRRAAELVARERRPALVDVVCQPD